MSMFVVLVNVSWVFCFFIVSISANTLHQALVVVSGVEKIISCENSTDRPEWRFYKLGNQTHYYVLHNGFKLHPTYGNESYDVRVTNSSSGLFRSDLTLRTVNTKHAGTYSCFDGHSSSLLTWHDVSILAAEPNCTINSIDSLQTRSYDNQIQAIRIHCAVTLTGNWQPVFTCQPPPHQQEFRNTSNQRTYNVSYYHILEVNNAQRKLHASCELIFKLKDVLAVNFSSPTRWSWSTEYEYQIPTVNDGSTTRSEEEDFSTKMSTVGSHTPYYVLALVTVVTMCAVITLIVVMLTSNKRTISRRSQIERSGSLPQEFNDDNYLSTSLYDIVSSALPGETYSSNTEVVNANSSKCLYADLAPVDVGTRVARKSVSYQPRRQNAIYADIDHTVSSLRILE